LIKLKIGFFVRFIFSFEALSFTCFKVFCHSKCSIA
jgi:hypothetical protein